MNLAIRNVWNSMYEYNHLVQSFCGCSQDETSQTAKSALKPPSEVWKFVDTQPAALFFFWRGGEGRGFSEFRNNVSLLMNNT